MCLGPPPPGPPPKRGLPSTPPRSSSAPPRRAPKSGHLTRLTPLVWGGQRALAGGPRARGGRGGEPPWRVPRGRPPDTPTRAPPGPAGFPRPEGWAQRRPPRRGGPSKSSPPRGVFGAWQSRARPVFPRRDPRPGRSPPPRGPPRANPGRGPPGSPPFPPRGSGAPGPPPRPRGRFPLPRRLGMGGGRGIPRGVKKPKTRRKGWENSPWERENE